MNLESLASFVQMFDPAELKDTGEHSRPAFPAVRSVCYCQALYDYRIRGKNESAVSGRGGFPGSRLWEDGGCCSGGARPRWDRAPYASALLLAGPALCLLEVSSPPASSDLSSSMARALLPR